jgi:glucose/arabinose dehydrogenase
VRTLVAGTIALLVGFPPSLHAHELDEYLQAARVSLARDHVVCEIDLTPGAAIAAEIVALVDRDADRLVSPAEAEAYGRGVLRDVLLELDGQAVPMTLTRVDVPSVEEMTDGVGTIRLEAIANIDPLAPGRRHVYFRNDHHPDAAVYLVNALVPEQRDIMVVGQTRDPRQHEIRLEYDVQPTAAGQWTLLLLGGICLSTLVVSRLRSRLLKPGVDRRLFMARDWCRIGVGLVSTLAAVVLTVAVWAQQQQPQIGIAPVAVAAGPYVYDTAEQHRIRVVVVAQGLPHPFSLAFLANGDALVTERGGKLRLVRGATGPTPVLQPEAIGGTPQQPSFRTGGLQEVALHPQFATNKFVYFTYNKAGEPVKGGQPGQRQSAITLFRARLDGAALTDVQELFMGDWQNGASGSRIAFGPNATVFITTGAPFGEQAQDPNTVYGKVLRLTDEGRVPKDNPFVGKTGTRPEIFSMGHRDQLGLTIHPATGAVLTAEHGPNGGDEINLILPGRNYGWPKITFGRDYLGPRLSESPVAPGIEPPLLIWIPSIAPTGLTFYTGDRLPAWKGNLFVGSARRGEVPRTGSLERVVFNDKLEELRRESLLSELHQRIRDVRQGPDGLLYVITDEDNGALLRIEPMP